MRHRAPYAPHTQARARTRPRIHQRTRPRASRTPPPHPRLAYGSPWPRNCQLLRGFRSTVPRGSSDQRAGRCKNVPQREKKCQNVWRFHQKTLPLPPDRDKPSPGSWITSMIARVIFDTRNHAHEAARELAALGYQLNYDGAVKITIHDRDAYDLALCLTERYKAWIAPFCRSINH